MKHLQTLLMIAIILISSVVIAQVDVTSEFGSAVAHVEAYGWVEEITVFYLFQNLPPHIRLGDKLSLNYKDNNFYLVIEKVVEGAELSSYNYQVHAIWPVTQSQRDLYGFVASDLSKLTVTNLSLYPFDFYIPSPDTLYVLPGESWFLQHGVESISKTDNKIIALRAIVYNQELSRFDGLEYYWQTKEFGGPDGILYDGTVFLEKNYYSHRYTWLANSSDSGLDFLYLFNVYATNNLPVGEMAGYSLYVEIGTQQLQSYYLSLTRTITSIDGIRGDVNDDGVVDKQEDVELLASYVLSSLDYRTRYTKKGINYGRGAVLFSQPDLISAALINIWVNNSSDPLVQGLGIGELMSKRPGNSPIIVTDVSSEISGRVLNIRSVTGNVFNVTARLEDGSFWQETKIANDGSLSVEMPEKVLDYKVEAVKFDQLSTTGVKSLKEVSIPNNFSLNQNYPNPFNPTTTISYSLPTTSYVTLIVYNLTGQEVTTLVNKEETAGSYEVQFSASNLPSGIYFYKLHAGEFSQVRRMQLVK